MNKTFFFVLIVFSFLVVQAQTQQPQLPQIPTGTVIAFAGKVDTPPTGWLPCDGREVSVEKYPELSKVIGTIYGGDGVTMFKLPNLCGRVVVGAGKGGKLNGEKLTPRVLGESDGEEKHTLSTEEIPSHYHIQTLDDNIGAVHQYGGTANGLGGTDSSGVENGRTRREGGSLPHNNMQPFLVLNYLIKL